MSPRIPRRGITLMEVLIAIGILAVGLTSVVSLVPAGQSQAARAVILDRAAATVANGLQDAVTYGLTRPDSVTFDSNGSGPVWVFDPVVQRAGVAANTVFPNAAGAFLKTAGVYAQTSTPAGTPSWQVLQLLGQGRDDHVNPAPSLNGLLVCRVVVRQICQRPAAVMLHVDAAAVHGQARDDRLDSAPGRNRLFVGHVASKIQQRPAAIL